MTHQLQVSMLPGKPVVRRMPAGTSELLYDCVSQISRKYKTQLFGELSFHFKICQIARFHSSANGVLRCFAAATSAVLFAEAISRPAQSGTGSTIDCSNPSQNLNIACQTAGAADSSARSSLSGDQDMTSTAKSID
jgi:hypothetical protein